VLIGTPGVKTHIRGNTLHKLFNEMQLGARHGMITLDHDLLELYEHGEITYDLAVTMARFPESIRTRCA
jgi:Tfp pilus assembly pilus retraction ATPase PilT